ncbi:lipase-like [Xenia sp. Carnegie-2017]|uniref:lipase-like n=1 Tax=Xenia sp. Carnegie-2017 TaxID=2897299 RepID=UPI001F0398D4|nr:lipase-like [Xenia sp. Carnegie-2017]
MWQRKISRRKGQTSCKSCKDGEYNIQNGQTKCELCPVGHYCYWKGASPIKCGKGYYQDQRGQTFCKRCKDGEYNIQSGQSKCNICPVGHYCYWKNQSPKNCRKGRYQDQKGKTFCLICPSGSFCPSTGPVVPGNKTMLAIRNSVKYAAKAYEDVEPADSRLVDEKNDIQGFVKYQGNTIVVSFRGTDDINDWFRNINILRKKYRGCKNCKVHTGFSNIYYSVQQQMFSKVKALSHVHSNSTVLVTGQSLGGALATFAAVDLAKAGYHVDLITYGSPRLGNKEFSEYVDNTLNGLNLRVTFKNDYVSVLPPKLLGYWHVGQEIHCVGRKSCYEFPLYEDFTHVRTSINDHTMINYLAI